MTAPAISPTASANEIAGLREEFGSVFQRIAAGALEREETRTLPHEQVQLLKDTGFTSLRVPVDFGGRGVRLAVFLQLYLELATADSNVAHLLRGHIAHVEHLLLRPESAHREKWLHRIGAGDIVGNAASERTELTEITTVLEENNGTLSVSGTKYYTTGSLYADWISLSALHGEQRVNLLVSASDPGVSIRDDWDGFGQQLTASGSLTLEGVLVDAADVQVFELSDPHTAFRAALFQGILLFVAAGIAQNAVDDAVAFIKPRRRTFAVFGETIPAEQEIVQTTLGESAAKAYSAASIVLHLAGEFERYTSSQGAALSAEALALDTFKAQQVVLKLATDTATEIFEVGGASATSLSRRLDRHWRNARTVASHNPAKYRARLIGEQLLTGNFSLYSTRP